MLVYSSTRSTSKNIIVVFLIVFKNSGTRFEKTWPAILQDILISIIPVPIPYVGI